MLRIVPLFVLGAAILYVLFYMPTPYVIYTAGTAESIKPMVKIEQDDPEEKGAFMLTTVRMLYTNLFNYMLTAFNPDVEVYNKKDIFKDESPAEYDTRQVFIMQGSQTNAMQAAYSKAGTPFKLTPEGVLVMQATAGMPAENLLKAGDRIVSVDDVKIVSADDLHAYLQKKKVGDTVNVTVERKGKNVTVALPLSTLPPEKGKPASKTPAIGIVIGQMLSVKAVDAKKQIHIDAGAIGGPSAGLMFSLEMYNRLTPGDLSKGYQIAGTGTIDANGTVGPIGGIKYKIMASDREGAEIFFAPRKNLQEATDQAKKMGTKMKIVVVDKMDDALNYLEKLQPKAS